MVKIKFSGLGTHWQIIIDDEILPNFLEKEILTQATTFEKKYSRFLPYSEVSQINLQGSGEYQISEELAQILKFGIELSKNSQGYFNPAIGKILTSYGYDKDLKFTDQVNLSTTRGSIKLKKNKINLIGDAQLDLGGWGKGYLIDVIYDLLISHNVNYFLIDGGGDLRATSKKNGQSWLVALEHPLDNEVAIGVVELKNSALANSGSNKRKVGNFHHLIDFHSGAPINSFLSSHIFAPTATIADGLATTLFISPPEIREKLVKIYPIEYLLVTNDLNMLKSVGFVFKDS